MKTNLSLILVTMMTLTGVGISSAQTAPRSSSKSMPNGETTFVSEPITLETPTATLYGTLVHPQSRSRMPVVLIISGSGPTDRDGNSPVFKGPNNSLKLLAEGLAAHGIASLR